MTYDAVLVARRGLGVDELRLLSPRFMQAVRWALFAEKVSAGIGQMRAHLRDSPSGLTGQALTDWKAMRTAVRAEVARIDRTIYPPDDEDVKLPDLEVVVDG